MPVFYNHSCVRISTGKSNDFDGFPPPRQRLLAALSEHGLTPERAFRAISMQYKSRYGPRRMLLETTAQSLADYEVQYGKEGRASLAAWNKMHGLLNTIWEVYDFNEANPEFQTGNDILIHAGGSGRDWARGCIALDDADAIEIFGILRGARTGCREWRWRSNCYMVCTESKAGRVGIGLWIISGGDHVQ